MAARTGFKASTTIDVEVGVTSFVEDNVLCVE